MPSQKHLSARDGKLDARSALSGAGPAVFLDRDGTLIEEKEYLSEPSEIALIPGAAPALARLREAGFALVLITNQSAIGRGWLSEAKLAEIHTELERQLADEGVQLDAIYFCPDHDAADAPAPEDPRADRKPGAGMLLRAAEELNLALGESWMIGDHVRDLEAGRRAGCRGNLLVLTGHGETYRNEIQPGDFTCRDLTAAAQCILKSSRT